MTGTPFDFVFATPICPTLALGQTDKVIAAVSEEVPFVELQADAANEAYIYECRCEDGIVLVFLELSNKGCQPLR